MFTITAADLCRTYAGSDLHPTSFVARLAELPEGPEAFFRRVSLNTPNRDDPMTWELTVPTLGDVARLGGFMTIYPKTGRKDPIADVLAAFASRALGPT